MLKLPNRFLGLGFKSIRGPVFSLRLTYGIHGPDTRTEVKGQIIFTSAGLRGA